MSDTPIPIRIRGKDYALHTVSGTVSKTEVSSQTTVTTSGGGGTSFQGTGSTQSIQTEVKTTSFQKIYLTDKDGYDTIIDLVDSAIDCREGNQLSMVYLDPYRGKQKWVAGYNHNTRDGQYFYAPLEQLDQPVWMKVLIYVLGVFVFGGLLTVLNILVQEASKSDVVIGLTFLASLIGTFLLPAMTLGFWQGRRNEKLRQSEPVQSALAKMKSMDGPPASISAD